MADPRPVSETVPLSDGALSRLPQHVARPNYDRSALSPGIVHIGLGNFHRAHQAWYLHRLMQTGKALDWAVIGAGIRPYDVEMRKKLMAQDSLSTLIGLDPDGASAEVIGSMIDYVPIETHNTALIRQLSDPAVRIVSLTVTEGGYYADPVTGAFDPSHPDIVHDVGHPDRPITVFGALVAALKTRREREFGPFTVMSCDNLRGNGDLTRQAVLSLAHLGDPELADWIEANASFPNSMVDCIVPATGPREIALTRELGIEDAAPVSHENFRQWVLEDRFCAGRPPLEDVGVVFTDDVHAYETMKIRVLNAGHQVVANIGELLSVETIADCMSHPLIRTFFDKVQHEEILPAVAPVPELDPKDYLALITRRFANRAVVDTVQRVAFDGSSRHTGFVLPILRDQLEAGRPIEGLALVEALWARMCLGRREDGSEIIENDPAWSDLVSAAHAARARPQAWLDQRHYYGDLADHPALTSSFARWLTRLENEGVSATVSAYLTS